MDAAIQGEYDSWCRDQGSQDTIHLVKIDNHQRVVELRLAGTHRAIVTVPEGYPDDCDGSTFLVETHSSQSLWCNGLNEFLLESCTSMFQDLLRKAAALLSSQTRSGKAPRRHLSDASDSDVDYDDDDDYDYDDDDLSDSPMDDAEADSAFTTDWELEVAHKKKRWVAKEGELRKRLKQSQSDVTLGGDRVRADPGDVQPMHVHQPSELATEQASQIFSTNAASGILTNDLISIMQHSKTSGFTAEPIDDNIYRWCVKINGFPTDSALHQDLQEVKAQFDYDYIELQLEFAIDLFPFYPPIVKVVRPRLKDAMMQRVTSLESLQLSFWNPTTSCLQLIASIKEMLAQWARLDVHHEANDKSNKAGAYYVLEQLFLHLAQACELRPRANHQFMVNVQRAPQLKAKRDKDKQGYWAKGTGYGHGSRRGVGWDPKAYLAAQEEKDKQTGRLLAQIVNELRRIVQGDVPGLTIAMSSPLIDGSCLLPCIESHLQVKEILEITRHIKVYEEVIALTRFLAETPACVHLLGKLPYQDKSVQQLLAEQTPQLEVFLACVNRGAASSAAATAPQVSAASEAATPEVTSSGSPETAIVIALRALGETVNAALAAHGPKLSRPKRDERASLTARSASAAPEDQQTYCAALSPLQFDTLEFDGVSHVYSTTGGNLTGGAKAVMRVAQELSTLVTSLPLNTSSSVFVRSDEDNICMMKALITGPEGTPYSGGCFEFDVFFPPEYPLKPPLVTLVTTGSGKVRFNPNLYANGKVCLSLLGTWEGNSGETWNPSSSTVLQVLVSIQSLILVEEPWFNEPGHERGIGSEAGQASSEHYNSALQANTLRWGMVEQLRRPCKLFENVIKAHFYHRREAILQQADEWLAQHRRLRPSTGKGTYHQVAVTSVSDWKSTVRQLRAQLAKLDAWAAAHPELAKVD